MSRLDIALKHIDFTRGYTNELLRHIHVDDWYRMPHEGVTHIAWQVGHLASAQYRLLMERIRGKRPEDADLISDEFMEHFAKGSTPSSKADEYPSSADIVGVFDAVHAQAMQELPTLTDEVLDDPPEAPHPLLKTKHDVLCFMVQHEMLHAGQIGLLRRLFGEKPLR